jgi:hypothetical protein
MTAPAYHRIAGRQFRVCYVRRVGLRATLIDNGRPDRHGDFDVER